MHPLLPAEWAPQQAMFAAFPSHPALWQQHLRPAQQEVAAMVRQLAASVPVKLLADGAAAVAAATEATAGTAEIHDIPFGDVWLRDTGPLFAGPGLAIRCRFNGWGGKYDLPGDDSVGLRMAALVGATVEEVDMVLEGGAIDTDGETLITTEQCLLNRNRNPGHSRESMTALLQRVFAVRRVVWLGDGLLNDHTDGHVDNLARFVGKGRVAIPESGSSDDPNRAVFADAAARLQAAGLATVGVPSAGRHSIDGEIVPASHMNWIVANGQVLVPLYGGKSDAPALAAIGRLFPRHLVTGLPANHLLTGGGSFHCITQQVPEK